jgi:hypothetical protein
MADTDKLPTTEPTFTFVTAAGWVVIETMVGGPQSDGAGQKNNLSEVTLTLTVSP